VLVAAATKTARYPGRYHQNRCQRQQRICLRYSLIIIIIIIMVRTVISYAKRQVTADEVAFINKLSKLVNILPIKGGNRMK